MALRGERNSWLIPVRYRLLAQLETPQAKDDLARLSDAVAEGARDPAEAAAEFVRRLRAD